MNRKGQHFKRALWQYLNQPVFDSEAESIWEFSKFWHLYRVKLLQNCWQQEFDFQSPR